MLCDRNAAPDTKTLGGFFRAILSFPPEYPLMPPKMRFETPIFHPNIYPNGDVCISILHPPVSPFELPLAAVDIDMCTGR